MVDNRRRKRLKNKKMKIARKKSISEEQMKGKKLAEILLANICTMQIMNELKAEKVQLENPYEFS